jgi:hypothetical protein
MYYAQSIRTHRLALKHLYYISIEVREEPIYLVCLKPYIYASEAASATHVNQCTAGKLPILSWAEIGSKTSSLGYMVPQGLLPRLFNALGVLPS